jgi:putative transposase
MARCAISKRCRATNKVGWLRYRNSRPALGEIRQITVSLEGGRWMVALTMKRGEALLPCAGEIVAADRGVRDTLAMSTRQRIAPLNAYKKSFFRLRRYQRAVSRKMEAQKKSMGLDPKAPFPKGVHPKKSQRQRRAEARLAKCHATIAHQRRDWLHKVTSTIADEAAIVILEDLRTRQMTASAKGSVENPGSNIRQKAGLNRSILDQGWYLLEQMLGYKTAWRGGEVIKVPAPYTSQKCSHCGHIDAASRKDKAFVCTRCGHTDDADQNAAQNLLAAGLAVLAGRQAGQMDAEDTVQQSRPIRAGKPVRAKRQPANAEGGAFHVPL